MVVSLLHLPFLWFLFLRLLMLSQWEISWWRDYSQLGLLG